MRVERLGPVSYTDADARMQELLAERIAGTVPNTLLLVDVLPTFTVGRRRDAVQNLIDVGDVPVVQVARGGDVTWHGPGQIVIWPVVALPEGRRDLHRHLGELEEAAILTCAEFGLQAGRDDRNTGAWVGGRKICSIGIACRRWVTWHGLALNVAPDMGFFERINPCGFDATVMTSMARELGEAPPVRKVEASLVRHLSALLPSG